jgi:hypothetical protein
MVLLESDLDLHTGASQYSEILGISIDILPLLICQTLLVDGLEKAWCEFPPSFNLLPNHVYGTKMVNLSFASCLVLGGAFTVLK